MKIILLDIDGVLLEPLGYHMALKETVRQVSLALGFLPVRLTDQDIIAFESADVFSEWDSSAICAALLLEKIWETDTNFRFPAKISNTKKMDFAASPPDFQDFATRLNQSNLKHLRPLERSERLLLDKQDPLNPEQVKQLRDILHNARSAERSLTHNIFQELVLGSRVYAETYRHPAVLNTESYLIKYDRSKLTPDTHSRLKKWLENSDQRGAIFTSRPSEPLPGVFSTPEAELAVRLVDLQELPILGLGSLAWLSRHKHQNPQAYLKPSPVHVLAALQLALGNSREKALLNAFAISQNEEIDPSWDRLQNSEIFVFEDTVSGMESALAATKILRKRDLDINLTLIGIAENPKKTQALDRLSAQLYLDLHTALKDGIFQ